MKSSFSFWLGSGVQHTAGERYVATSFIGEGRRYGMSGGVSLLF